MSDNSIIDSCSQNKTSIDGASSEPLTVEFQDELLTAPNPESFIDTHANSELNLPRFLKRLLEEKHLVRKDVVRAARLNETYGWEIFSDPSKRPSRDKLLAIAFAMSLSVDETRRLLRHGRVNELYVKNKRDAIITICVKRGASLSDVDRLLYEQDLPTIAG